MLDLFILTCTFSYDLAVPYITRFSLDTYIKIIFSCKWVKNRRDFSLGRYSYFTQVILPRLSYVDYPFVVLELTHLVVK